jgi:tRNA threonylcarbamoyladenosine biosynthesis protein TsaB
VSIILGIDTASDRFALAVDRDGVVTSLEADASQDHSRLLLPAIREALGGNACDAILVVIGPGAYAGVRAGIATAEGLSIGRDVPVFGIGTLEAAALAAGEVDVTVIHPAGRGEFAAQRFVHGVAQSAPQLATRDALQGSRLAGEGAGELGGREVSARDRIEAAIRDRAPKIRAGALEQGVEAFYLREPNITLSRRQRAAS